MPCFSATLQEKGTVDVARMFSIEEASAQAGLEKTLLKAYGRELQSLAMAHRYSTSYFTAAEPAPSRCRARAAG